MKKNNLFSSNTIITMIVLAYGYFHINFAQQLDCKINDKNEKANVTQKMEKIIRGNGIQNYDNDDKRIAHKDSYVTSDQNLNISPTLKNLNQPTVHKQKKLKTDIDIKNLLNLNRQYLEGQIVVKFKAEKIINFNEDRQFKIGIQEVDKVFDELDVYSIEEIYSRTILPDELRNTVLLNFAKNLSIQTVIEKFSSLKDVEWVHPNYIYKLTDQPNDPGFSNQWYLNTVEASQAWDLGLGSPNIIIGIIDSGVDWDHPDLQNTIWVNSDEIVNNGVDDDANGYIDDIRGWDWVTGIEDAAFGEDGQTPDNNPMDFNGHGTHCSGIAGATTNNGVGIAGVSRGCRIMALRAGWEDTNGDGWIAFSFAASAFDYAIENGASVINMSFAGGEELLTVVTNAYNNNIIVVHSAGNEDISSPSAVDDIVQTISVAATNQSDQKAYFSNYGSWVDVSAPGVSIYSTDFNNNYSYKSGTSMAAPLVAGLAALILSQNSSLNPNQVIDIIVNSADNIDGMNPAYTGQLGNGRINVFNALSNISPPSLAVTSPNGGENWEVGSSHNITWTSSSVTNVKIEYTTNNGSSWSTVISSTASDGSYGWTIPNTPSTTCKVKITDVSNASISDQSNNIFTISSPPPPPAITVTSPNGGENWEVGSSHNITWTSTNVTNVKIEYTTNNGSSWLSSNFINTK